MRNRRLDEKQGGGGNDPHKEDLILKDTFQNIGNPKNVPPYYGDTIRMGKDGRR
jgi:hypothetical protein